MTQSLNMTPTQWAPLEDIDDVQPIHDGDYACLAEIRDILTKHGKRDRFGVALLHSHFEMASDEVLMEYSNKKDRILTIKPGKPEAGRKIVETIWALRDGDNAQMLHAQQICVPPTNHDSRHHVEE